MTYLYTSFYNIYSKYHLYQNLIIQINIFHVKMPSILTFNFSVAKKKKLADYKEPFQIMPATVNYVKDSDIDKYKNISNNNIIIHLNYVTRMFSSNGLEKDSTIRYSLRQYAKLADKIGTKDILIHMPKSLQEWNNFILGYKIIHDELLSKGYNIHFEITAWTKDLHEEFGKETNRISVVKNYYDVLFDAAKSYGDTKYVYVVIDTAHMFSNGCTENDIIQILKEYDDKIKYIHWNGNLNKMFSSDSHVPIFDTQSKMSYDKISTYVAKLDKICVCEITKEDAPKSEWERYANRYGFHLVSDL